MSGCVYLLYEFCLNIIESEIDKVLLEISDLSYEAAF